MDGLKQAKKFCHAANDTLGYLYDRWQDEKGYEDINDYSKPLTQIATDAVVKVEEMTAKPFGCIISADGNKFIVRVTVKGLTITSWEKISNEK